MRTFARLAAESVESAAVEMNRALGFAVELGGGRLSPAGEAQVLQRAVFSEGNLLLAALDSADGRPLLHLADERVFPRGAGRPHSPHEARHGGAPPRQGALAAWAAPAAAASSTGRVSWGAVSIAGGQPFLPIVYPLADGRILRAAYGLGELQRRLRGLRGGASGRVVLAGPRGAPLPGFAGPGLLAEGAGLPETNDPAGWRENLAGAQEPLVGAWAKTGSLGWTAWSLQPRAEAFAVDERAGQKALGVFALLVLLVSAVAMWLSRRISSPLAALVTGARRSAEGRFDAQVPEGGWGEFRQVAHSFNAMMRSLEQYRLLQVDKQLAEKAKLEVLVRTVPSGIILAGADGKLLYVNSAARQILDTASLTAPGGLRAAEILRDARMIELLQTALSERGRLHARELGAAVAGKERIFFCQARAVESRGVVYGALLVLHDVTAERELQALRERFLQAIVHDLRGPITTISGWVEILQGKKGNLPPLAEKGIKMVQSGIRNMTELVDNILDSAKLKAGGVRPMLAPIPIAALLEEVRDLFVFRAEVCRVALRVEAPAAGAAVLCDRRLIGRSLANLVGNALKYTPSGGSVTLRATSAAGRATLSVIDNGSGIPKEKLAGVFLPFEQVSAEDQNTGFGLGLSLVKEFIELHGGRIRVESELGKGTTFTFTLPLAPATAPPRAEPREAGR